MDLQLTISQIKIISHALGVPIYQIMLYDFTKKSRTLPNEFLRNYYTRPIDWRLEGMLDRGLVKKRTQFGQTVFHVTKKGISLFRDDFKKLCPYIPKKKRKDKLLKQSIESYCKYNHYKFGESNSEVIIHYYLHYYKKGAYISHTIKDVINTLLPIFEKYEAFLTS